VLGLTLAGGLWWAYFDVTSHVAERALAAAPAERRAGMARDAYSFLHLPLVAGIVLLALGLKKVLEYVGDQQAHALTEPLKGIPLAALVGGVALYLLAHVAFLRRTTGSVNAARLVVALLLVPAGWTLAHLPALAALACLTAAVVALLAVEYRHAADRDRIRHEEGRPGAPH
jgi:low temperature requirement protein LtrA